jgi:MFS family permease
VQATRELGATDGDVAIYSAILLASQTISTLGWGAIANRLRLMNVMLAGTVLAGSASLLAFMAPSSTIIMLVFALAGASMGAIVVSDGALPLSFAEDSKQDRSLYVAVANTAVSPINLIAPLLGGALADAGGYGTTYVIASLLAVLAAVATVTASTKRPAALSRTLS